MLVILSQTVYNKKKKKELERERNCDTFSAAWYLKKQKQEKKKL